MRENKKDRNIIINCGVSGVGGGGCQTKTFAVVMSTRTVFEKPRESERPWLRSVHII